MFARGCVALVVMCVLAFVAPASASFPGENGQIAFTRYVGSSTQVFAVEPDGTGVHQVSAEQFGATGPQWSPDGLRVAYEAEHGEIYRIAADGTGRSALTDNVIPEYDPAWSPDGLKVAFVAHQDLYVLDLLSGERTQLTHFFNTDASVITPDWSPDGTEIAFASAPAVYSCDEYGCSVDYFPHDIWKVAAAGGDPVRLTFDQDQYPPGQDPTEQVSPSWSPDGTRIAFSDQQDVWAMDADGSNQARLTTASEPERGPVWSPDGTRVAFLRDRDILTMDVAGGDIQPVLQNDPDLPSSPDWQPVPAEVPFSYIHPKQAATVRFPLVPAAKGCSSPNRAHGPPLAFGSCSPAEPQSPYLRVSQGNARAHSTGYVRMAVRPGSPRYPDDTDVQIRFSITNVMNAYDLSDYSGLVSLSLGVRLTDRDAGLGGATLQDMTFTVYDVPCQATADPGRGGTCESLTSIDAVVPGAAPERMGAIWELEQIRVYDGGPYGDGADPELFATQGVFVP